MLGIEGHQGARATSENGGLPEDFASSLMSRNKLGIGSIETEDILSGREEATNRRQSNLPGIPSRKVKVVHDQVITIIKQFAK